MATSSDLRRQIKAAVEEYNIGVTELSSASGVNRSTIYRVLSDDYEFTPSARTLDKITLAIFHLREVEVIREEEDARRVSSDGKPQLQETLPVLYEVGEGFWNESEDADPDDPFAPNWHTFQAVSGISHIAVDPRFKRENQALVVARGPSANRVFQDGDLVHIITSTILQTIILRKGDFVLVVKKAIRTGGFQMRIYELVASTDRYIALEAPTDDPHYTHRIALNLNDNVFKAEKHEFYIAGVVIGYYRKLHYLSS